MLALLLNRQGADNKQTKFSYSAHYQSTMWVNISLCNDVNKDRKSRRAPLVVILTEALIQKSVAQNIIICKLI